jgi:nucleotide-binding universal stress UspA family protein
MTEVGTILVPVDGSPGGALALASSVALAGSMGARIVLLQVVVPILAYETLELGGYGDGLYFDPAWDDEALEAAKRYTAGLADRLRSTGARAEGVAVVGDVLTPSTSVVDAIVATADRIAADLIVMSTHAHTGPARLLLGSTADALVRSSHRPVLLVRRESAAAAEAVASATPSEALSAEVEPVMHFALRPCAG